MNDINKPNQEQEAGVAEAVTFAGLKPTMSASDSANQIDLMHDLVVKNMEEVKKNKNLSYKTMVSLILDDSGHEDYGMVRLIGFGIGWGEGMGDVVGTWTRSRYDNAIRISVAEPLTALQDKATAIWMAYVEARKSTSIEAKKSRRSPKTPEHEQQQPSASTPTQTDVERVVQFNSLRAKLKK